MLTEVVLDAGVNDEATMYGDGSETAELRDVVLVHSVRTVGLLLQIALRVQVPPRA